MCELAHGAPADLSMHAAHRCNNRACVNPQHIRWATPFENNLDKHEHGTMLRGSKHPHAKLSENDVLDMLGRLDRGERVKDVRERYSISWQCLDEIRKGLTWGWLTGRGQS